jgi:hypothetical protein
LMLILILLYRSVHRLLFYSIHIWALFAQRFYIFERDYFSHFTGISSHFTRETTDYSIYVLTHLRNNKNIKLLYKDITKPLLLWNYNCDYLYVLFQNRY